MKDFLKATGSAFVGCFLAIWAFGKCKNSVCAETAGKQAKKVDKKVEEKVAQKVDEIQTETPKEETKTEQPTFVEVEVETEEPKKQAVKREKVVSGATEVARGIY